MNKNSSDFDFPKDYTPEGLQKVLDVSLDHYEELLSPEVTPAQKMDLLVKLAVNLNEFKMAFEEVKGANKAGNETADKVMQKLALKIQYCDMLTKGAILRDELRLQTNVLEIAEGNLRGTIINNPGDFTGAQMHVVNAKAALECTRLNLRATQQAIRSIQHSNESKETVDISDSKATQKKGIEKILEETKGLIRDIHKAESDRARSIAPKTVTRESVIADSFSAKRGKAGEKIQTDVDGLCESIRKTKSSNKEHETFKTMRDLSRELSAMTDKIPHYLINQETVITEGVIKTKERKGNDTRAKNRLINAVQDFEIKKAEVLSKIPKEEIRLSQHLERLSVNTLADGKHAIDFLNIQQEALDIRIHKITEEVGKTKEPKEFERLNGLEKKLSEVRQSLEELKGKTKIANDRRHENEDLVEIVEKHDLSEKGSKKNPAGILDLKSHWTTSTLADNHAELQSFRMIAATMLDSKMSAADNTAMYALIEKREGKKVDDNLLPRLLSDTGKDIVTSYQKAWQDSDSKIMIKDKVESLCKRVMLELPDSVKDIGSKTVKVDKEATLANVRLDAQRIIDEELANHDHGISDPRIVSLIKERGAEFLENAVGSKFVTPTENIASMMLSNIERAWTAEGSLAVKAAAQNVRANFDINNIPPLLKQKVIHQLAEATLQAAGLCKNLESNESGVNRMNYLLSREISQTSAALVESSTKDLGDRKSVEQSSVRQRSMSNPQPPTSQLDDLSTVNKSAPKVAATLAPPKVTMTKPSDSMRESRPRAQSTAALSTTAPSTVVPSTTSQLTAAPIKMVRGSRASEMPTAPPPKPPSAPEASLPAASPKPAASWARARSSSVLEASKESKASESVTEAPIPPRRSI